MRKRANEPPIMSIQDLLKELEIHCEEISSDELQEALGSLFKSKFTHKKIIFQIIFSLMKKLKKSYNTCSQLRYSNFVLQKDQKQIRRLIDVGGSQQLDNNNIEKKKLDGDSSNVEEKNNLNFSKNDKNNFSRKSAKSIGNHFATKVTGTQRSPPSFHSGNTPLFRSPNEIFREMENQSESFLQLISSNDNITDDYEESDDEEMGRNKERTREGDKTNQKLIFSKLLDKNVKRKKNSKNSKSFLNLKEKMKNFNFWGKGKQKNKIEPIEDSEGEEEGEEEMGSPIVESTAFNEFSNDNSSHESNSEGEKSSNRTAEKLETKNIPNDIFDFPLSNLNVSDNIDDTSDDGSDDDDDDGSSDVDFSNGKNISIDSTKGSNSDNENDSMSDNDEQKKISKNSNISNKGRKRKWKGNNDKKTKYSKWKGRKRKNKSHISIPQHQHDRKESVVFVSDDFFALQPKSLDGLQKVSVKKKKSDLNERRSKGGSGSENDDNVNENSSSGSSSNNNNHRKYKKWKRKKRNRFSRHNF